MDLGTSGRGKKLLHLAVLALIAGGLVYGWRAKRMPPPVAPETTQTDAAAGKSGADGKAADVAAAQQAAAAVSTPAGAKAAGDDSKAGKSEPGQQPAQDDAGKTGVTTTETAKTETKTEATKPGAPAPGSLFNDTRTLAPVGEEIKPGGAAAAATSTPAPAPQTATAAGDLFRDTRSLTDVAQGPAASATAAPAQPPSSLFRDPRPLSGTDTDTSGSLFRDARALTPPSFRDERPMLAGGAATTAAVAAPDTTTPAAPVPTTPQTAAAVTGGMGGSPTPASATPPASATSPGAASTTSPAASAATAAPASSPATAPTVAAKAPAPTPAPEPTAARGQPALPTIVAVNAPPIRVDAAACAAPELTSEPLEGGRMRILVNASCRPGEAVQMSYGGAELIRKLDAFGRLDTVLDCFAGAKGSVLVRFADGTQQSLPVTTRDLDKVSKVAVVWHAPVNLDLHVFEYAARADQPGHIWAKSASTLPAARAQVLGDKRGHGFLSSIDDAASLGDKVEVYTFLHSDEQTSGAISLALDYETRGDTPSGATCGQGALAEVDFQVVMLPRGGEATRQPGVLTRVECGRHIAREARLNPSALPGLRIKR